MKKHFPQRPSGWIASEVKKIILCILQRGEYVYCRGAKLMEDKGTHHIRERSLVFGCKRAAESVWRERTTGSYIGLRRILVLNILTDIHSIGTNPVRTVKLVI